MRHKFSLKNWLQDVLYLKPTLIHAMVTNCFHLFNVFDSIFTQIMVAMLCQVTIFSILWSPAWANTCSDLRTLLIENVLSILPPTRYTDYHSLTAHPRNSLAHTHTQTCMHAPTNARMLPWFVLIVSDNHWSYVSHTWGTVTCCCCCCLNLFL